MSLKITSWSLIPEICSFVRLGNSWRGYRYYAEGQKKTRVENIDANQVGNVSLQFITNRSAPNSDVFGNVGQNYAKVSQFPICPQIRACEFSWIQMECIYSCVQTRL